MRFLLVSNQCITDPTAGVTRSLRTIVEWLAEAGHGCEVLTTARMESPATLDVERHLAQLGIRVPVQPRVAPGTGRPRAGTRPVVRYAVGRVPVTMLMTRHNDEARPDRAEAAQFLDLLDDRLERFAPDQVIACNGHPMIREALARARARGLVTTFALRSYGYEDPSFFEHVDHVFTCSRFLSGYYRDRLGLDSTPIEPPIDWSSVVAPDEARAFVTFVHPAPHKGLFLFARLADMLGSRRPDIPLLVVQSGHSAGALNAIPGLDFSRYPQIMAAPPVATPAEYFALTRLLLVPSVWAEPFGRVAAEAMINAVPALVGDRGALPDVVGGDFADGGGGGVRPIPAWMTYETTRLPSEQEVRPWFDAVCALWDDAALYARVSARARQLADERYGEAQSRGRHLQYFTSRTKGGGPVVPSAQHPGRDE